jgi:hypothetical protein
MFKWESKDSDVPRDTYDYYMLLVTVVITHIGSWMDFIGGNGV